METLRRFDHVSMSTYSRLLLPDLIPKQVSRLIYLDCDVICKADLEELWTTDFDGHALLAVPDMMPEAESVSSPCGIQMYREFCLPAELPILNAGVMVLNLEKWRREEIALQALEYLRVARDYIRWHDQEAIITPSWPATGERWTRTGECRRFPCMRSVAIHVPRDSPKALQSCITTRR